MNPFSSSLSPQVMLLSSGFRQSQARQGDLRLPDILLNSGVCVRKS